MRESQGAFMDMLYDGEKYISQQKSDEKRKCKHSLQAPKTPQQLTPALILLITCSLCVSLTYAPQGPEPPPNHLAASCAPYNCSPRSALTWEDWLQAAACSSREQAWRRALGGNNFTPDPPPPRPRPQHELRTGFREKEEKHRVNQRRETGR